MKKATFIIVSVIVAIIIAGFVFTEKQAVKASPLSEADAYKYITSVQPVSFSHSDIGLKSDVKKVQVITECSNKSVFTNVLVENGKVNVYHFYSQYRLLDENDMPIGDWFALY